MADTQVNHGGLTTVEGETSSSLSPLQSGMLFHWLRRPGQHADIEQVTGRLRHALDPLRFRDAWQHAAQRHDALRSHFRWNGSQGLRQIVTRRVEMPFHYEDWRSVDESLQNDRLESFLKRDRQTGFDLDHPPLTRVALFRLGDDDYQLVWTFHHAILDGRSLAIVLRDVFAGDAMHGAINVQTSDRGSSPSVPQHGDFISWLESQEFADAESYWRELLAGCQPGAAPAEDPFAEVETGNALPFSQQQLSLSEQATADLRDIADLNDVTLGTIVQAAWAILLSRHTGSTDIVFGVARACRDGTIERSHEIAGMMMNTLPVRVGVDGDQPIGSWLQQLRQQSLCLRPFQHTGLVDIQKWIGLPAETPLFETVLIYDRQPLETLLQAEGDDWLQREFDLIEWTGYPLSLYATEQPSLQLRIVGQRARFSNDAIRRMRDQLATILTALAGNPEATVDAISMLPQGEQDQLAAWNDTFVDDDLGQTIHSVFQRRSALIPNTIALVQGDERITYRQLDERSSRLASILVQEGIEPGSLVGISMQRSTGMVIALLAIMKAGSVYLPLDPDYPAQRLAFMVDDAEVNVVITDDEGTAPWQRPGMRRLAYHQLSARMEAQPLQPPAIETPAEALSYVLYTSGSSGAPKGVMVTHRNVINFFRGMDDVIPHEHAGVWLNVTSISFDISVLEMFWTLTRGFTVVLASEQPSADKTMGKKRGEKNPGQDDDRGQGTLDFSLFYFASEESEEGASDKYRLLIEGSRFADTNGFAAIWIPERHFHAFGGLYPNPSVAAAAVATITKRVAIRAGSCVLPLHDPIRVAEEWSLVDNLSSGRVGISFASGWHPNDFVLQPEKFADCKQRLLGDIETVRRLWRGESIQRCGPDGEEVAIRTLPRPVQPELPVWLTAAGNPATFRRAGEQGFHLLTHLLGQDSDELAEKIDQYRRAWRQAGHAGDGHVTLMVHTLVGDDTNQVRELVREPLTTYLESSVNLIKAASWSFPALKERADRAGTDPPTLTETGDLSSEDHRALLEHAFDRYFETSGLFGTTDQCVQKALQLFGLGINELACLIDFGVPAETTLSHLGSLTQVREQVQSTGTDFDDSIAGLIRRHGVTHLQCTPSQAQMLVDDKWTRVALGWLDAIFVGGEALPISLGKRLKEIVGNVTNMYGPTETTIWSATHGLSGDEEGSVPIGRPIANTTLYVLDERGRQVPVGATGELYIGGDGVAAGYLNRPDLTAERFVPDPFIEVCRPSQDRPARMYKTGDLARYRSDGLLEFLGRNDQQIKLRGHRIELEEIEAVLDGKPSISRSLVMLREDVPGDLRLVAYLIAANSDPPDFEHFRNELRSSLPEIMIPSDFVWLDEFPMTPNRKLNRSALPPPTRSAKTVSEEELPTTRTEKSLANIWQKCLGLSRVGLGDHFFELGGHSLLAVDVISRIRESLAVELPLKTLFDHPTLADFAAAIDRELPFAGESSAVEVEQAIQQIFKQQLSLTLEDVDLDLIASGHVDSFTLIQVISLINEQLMVDLRPDQLEPRDYRSISSLASCVSRQKSSIS